MGKVVYGFPAVGKTTLYKKYGDEKNLFLDLESSDYHYVLSEKEKKLLVEERKGTKKKINPNWPENYFKAIVENLNLFKFVFVSHDGIDLCKKYNIPYWRIFPDYDCKEEYIERMKFRKNSSAFINKLEKNFESYVKESYQDKFCEKKFVLHKGEYIEDVFYREGMI